jgi:hypothetical protein
LVIPRALAAPHEGVKGGKEIERDQHRSAAEKLAVVDAPGRGQFVLEPPREPDAVVVMRVARPARPGAPDDRLPQAGHALGKAEERRAHADRLYEGEGAGGAAHACRRMLPKHRCPARLELAGRQGGGASIGGGWA